MCPVARQPPATRGLQQRAPPSWVTSDAPLERRAPVVAGDRVPRPRSSVFSMTLSSIQDRDASHDARGLVCDDGKRACFGRTLRHRQLRGRSFTGFFPIFPYPAQSRAHEPRVSGEAPISHVPSVRPTRPRRTRHPTRHGEPSCGTPERPPPAHHQERRTFTTASSNEFHIYHSRRTSALKPFSNSTVVSRCVPSHLKGHQQSASIERR